MTTAYQWSVQAKVKVHCRRVVLGSVAYDYIIRRICSVFVVIMATFTSVQIHFSSASALLAMQTAVIARPILSVCPSRSGDLSKRMKIRSCGLQNQVSSFWRGKVYRDIRRGSPSARALKWSDPLSLAKIWTYNQP